MHIDFLKDVWNAVIFQLALSIREQSSGGEKQLSSLQFDIRHFLKHDLLFFPSSFKNVNLGAMPDAHSVRTGIRLVSLIYEGFNKDKLI